ncbi:hypothetical protein ACWD9K_00065 [Streptomyces sp. 900116325]
MANVAARRNKAGEVSSYQVRWREGGVRTGEQQTERFDDEDSAIVFRDAFDEAGSTGPQAG